MGNIMGNIIRSSKVATINNDGESKNRTNNIHQKNIKNEGRANIIAMPSSSISNSNKHLNLIELPVKTTVLKMLVMKVAYTMNNNNTGDQNVLFEQLREFLQYLSSQPAPKDINVSSDQLKLLRETWEELKPFIEVVVINPDKFSLAIGLLKIINELQNIVANILRVCNKCSDAENDTTFKLIDIRKNWSEWSSQLNKQIGKSVSLNSYGGDGSRTCVSVSLLQLECSILQLMVIAFPDPSSTKNMLIAGSNILFGTASSIAKMSLDPRLVAGLISSVTLGMEMLRRKSAEAIVNKFNIFQTLVKFAQEKFNFSISASNCKGMTSEKFLNSFIYNGTLPQDIDVSLKTNINYLKYFLQLIHDSCVADNSTSIKRWEVYAAFAVTLTDIYICISTAMNSLIYQFCLAKLIEEKILISDYNGNIKVTSIDVLYDFKMDSSLKGACQDLMNVWIHRIKQKYESKAENDKVVMSFSNDTIQTIMIPDKVFEQFESLFKFCMFILKGTVNKTFHYNLSSLLKYGDSQSMLKTGVFSMMMKICEWGEEFKDFLFSSSNVKPNLSDWIKRSVDMLLDEGETLVNSIENQLKLKFSEMESSFFNITETLNNQIRKIIIENSLKDTSTNAQINEPEIISGSSKKILKKTSEVEIEIIDTVGIEIELFITGARQGQKLLYFISKMIRKFLSYLKGIDSILSRIIPSKLIKLLKSDYVKFKNFTDNIQNMSNMSLESEIKVILDKINFDDIKVKYLAAINSVRSHYNMLKDIVDPVIVKLNYETGVMSDITVSINNESINIKTLFEQLVVFEGKVLKHVTEAEEEINQLVDADEPKCKDIFEKFTNLLISRTKEHFKCSSYADLIKSIVITSFPEEFTTIKEDAEKYMSMAGNFFEQVLVALDKFKTLQSLLMTMQSKCVDVDDAISKSISVLNECKNKLHNLSETNWKKNVSKEELDNIISSLLNSFNNVTNKTNNNNIFQMSKDLMKLFNETRNWFASDKKTINNSAKTNLNDLKNLFTGQSSEFLNQFDGLKKQLDFDVVKLRDDAVVEIEEKMKEALVQFNSTVENAKSSIENVLNIDVDSSDCEGLLQSVGGLVSDYIATRKSRLLKWKVREVTAFCMRRLIASSNTNNEHLKLLRQLLTKRKVFESKSSIRTMLDEDNSDDTQSLKAMNNVFGSSQKPFISSSEFNEIDQKVVQEKEKAIKQAWIEEENAIFLDIISRLETLDTTRKEAEGILDNPMMKQEILARCKLEHKALQQAASNVKDISKKLDIIVNFLGDINSQLTVMDEKLDRIQQDISAMRDDLKRLVGRPPLDVINEWSQRYLLDSFEALQSKVYVEAEVCRAGPKKDFKKDDVDNPSIPVSKAFQEFINSKEKLLLLLSGMAGSGKSTAVEMIKSYILDAYTKELKEKDVTVVLVPVSLPTLKDPLSGVFEEGMRLAYNRALSADQVHELLEMIQKPDGKIQLVFILDAYDEIRQDFQGKNLYLSNNIDKYMPLVTDKDAEKLLQPKVIITCRSEYLSTFNNSYKRFYVPIVVGNKDRDTEKSAETYFEEFRFIEFHNKRKEYQSQYVALKWRDLFLSRFKDKCSKKYFNRDIFISNSNDIDNFDVQDVFGFNTDDNMIINSAYKSCTLAYNSKTNSTTYDTNEFDNLKENVSSCFKELQDILLKVNKSEFIESVCKLISLFIVLFQLDHKDRSLINSIVEFINSYITSESLIWILQQYDSQFIKTPELLELSTTPFMVEVVTEILPTLHLQRRSNFEIKSSLILMFGETIAEETWAVLNENKFIIEINEVQRKLDSIEETTDNNENKESREEPYDLNRIAKIVIDNFLMKQKYDVTENPLEEDNAEVTNGSEKKKSLEVTEDVFNLLLSDAPLKLKDNLLQTMAEMEKTTNDNIYTTADKLFSLDEYIENLAYGLLLALKRPPRRRNTIYDSFVDLYIKREVNKAITNRNGFVSNNLYFECQEYAKHLALSLTSNGRSKLAKRMTSEVFSHEKRDIDIFFNESQLITAVRKAAPVKEAGGFLGFVHKSIQEFYVAQMIVVHVVQLVEDCNINNKEFSDFLYYHGSVAIDSEMAKASFQLSWQERKSFLEMISKLQTGPFGLVTLNDESAVIDFITDYLLSSIETLQCFQFIWRACSFYTTSEYFSKEEADRDLLKIVKANFFSICTKKMPRRKNRTLLHEAAFEGIAPVVLFVIDVIYSNYNNKENEINNQKDKKDFNFIDETDDENKTSLYRAQEGGHFEICRILMDFRANHSIKAKTTAAISLISSTRGLYGDEGIINAQGVLKINSNEHDDEGHVKIIGCREALLDMSKDSNDCYMFEVEVLSYKSRSEDIYFNVGWIWDTRSLLGIGLNNVKSVGSEEGTISINGINGSCLVSGSSHDLLTRSMEENQIDLRNISKENIFIGTAIDFSNKFIYFSMNGVWARVNPSLSQLFFSSGKRLFPAVSFHHCLMELKFNIGYRDFKFPIPLSQFVSANDHNKFNKMKKIDSSSVAVVKDKKYFKPVVDVCEGAAAVIVSAVKRRTKIFKLFVSRAKVVDNLIDTVNDSTGDTLMHYLVQLNYITEIKEILEVYGVDRLKVSVKKQNYFGMTPFMLTCYNDEKRMSYNDEKRMNDEKIEIVEFLVDKGLVTEEDLQIKNNHGWTGFMLACEYGQTGIVELLVDKGLVTQEVFQMKNRHGKTGFMLACKNQIYNNIGFDYGRTEIVKLLVDKGLVAEEDLQMKDNDNGRTGFMWACERGETRIVNLMVKKGLVTEKVLQLKDNNGSTGFMLAYKNGQTRIVELLVEEGLVTKEKFEDEKKEGEVIEESEIMNETDKTID